MLVLAIVLIALPQLVGSIVSDVLGFVGIGLMLALGLNIIVGNAGLLHLGFVVFYTIGAYTTALLMGASPVTALGSRLRSCRSTSRSTRRSRSWWPWPRASAC